MRTKFNGILTLLLVLFVQISFAQEKTVSGTVADESGPLPGVTVIKKGTTQGTETDFEGNYAIKVKTGEVLVFSFVGMKTVEKTVGASNQINITMETDNLLDEVVVVAYGTQKREAITGSVQVVDTELIENQQVTSPLRALQGSVAGVNLLTSGGQPGSNPTINIRGIGSLSSGTAPLIVLDGAPYSGNLNAISQDQIASISVLKDASSASLYGSRAANGVILITTKRGKRNTAAKVTVRSQYGISNPAVGIHDLVNQEDYLKLTWQAIRNNNQYGLGQSATDAANNATNQLIPTLGYNPFSTANPIDNNGNLVAGSQLLWDTKWEDVILRDNVSRINHSLSVTGGSDNTNYSFSLDYLNEEGPVIISDFERISTRAAIDTDVNDWLKTGITTGFSRSSSNNPDQTSGSTTQAISYIYNNSSIYPIYVRDANGQLILDSDGNRIYDLGNGNGRPVGQSVNSIRPGINGENILASLELGSEKRIRTSFTGSAYAEVSFLDKFKLRSTMNYESFMFDSHSFDDDLIGAASNVGGRVSKTRNVTSALNFVEALNYSDSYFGGTHKLSFDAIYEVNYQYTDTFRASSTGFLPGQEEFGSGTVAESFGGLRAEQRIASILGRLSYSINDKYFIDASYRQDDTSQFSKAFRTGDFFSVGASWSIHKENFLSNVEWINNLRIRGSYGELGNINLPGGFFPTSALFSGANFGNITLSPVEGNASFLPGSTLIDPNLTWETTATSNFGLDFGLFNNNFTGSVEYFKRNSIDLVQDITTTASTGAPNLRTNAGDLENRGWEVTLNGNIFNKEDFQWSVGGNFTFLENELKKLNPFFDRRINGSKLWIPGSSIQEFYIREWAGVDPATGDALWYQDQLDANGNVTGRTTTNVYDDATRYQTGKNSIPDIQGGFNTSLRYKNFDLSLLFNYSFGGWLLDTDYSGLIASFANAGGSAHPDNFKAWQQPGDITDFPRLTTANNSFNNRSTRFLFKNDYIRLKNITFGYNLPSDILNNVGLSKVRLYLLGENMFTWQSHKGIDPEQAFNGLTANRSPLQKTITFGTLIEF
ncbi:SusC/RagA family TonB-linked outer membrane protein [Tenacibaculum aiptasiae]|uniref:SusC/RagA family TonB-linked outer membrane protein n=1 Tax=Tenacibaculum aiptasiae TaxID=426481 RepID=UPI00232B6C20|nr:TonB-dependent receptor [Tenacibaculum aiptasiae]